MTSAEQHCIRFDNLTLGYQSRAAVHHLSGVVREGSLTAIVGGNGSGKSTLLKGIVGVLKPMSGTCIRHARRDVAYLPQQSELDRSFPARVVDLVMMGLWPKRGLLRRFSGEDHDTILRAIREVGLEGFEERDLDTLSGGQLQRALFARVIVQDAPIILLDEPFNAVDARTLQHLIELIQSWHRGGRTVMVVVHDLELVRRHFPETLLLARSLVSWGKTADALTPDNLFRASTLHEAWDEDAPWCEAESKHAHARDDHGHGSAHHHHHDAA
ncbi:zinc ABC transporter ATP-binding protein AztA [Limoniibacter endophyticus]|uniref:ABC transporter n=1 Tax=Limoniibacter endophyticus TaxID=1565040 RepID=A0A8J3GG73_9HYPH|nr:zinc ABC transporter ATP-binding protein AztA [Limoniibacter endophyticus]GHC63733.1 ABC transporter [Limoniibacter endophyticus]